jgi:hypothetical protein
MAIPGWIYRMLGRHTCERCRNRSLDQGRVTFVGVARSEKPFPPRSMLLIEFECSRCHTVYRIHEDRPIEHIIEAVESFGRYDEDFVLPGYEKNLNQRKDFPWSH